MMEKEKSSTDEIFKNLPDNLEDVKSHPILKPLIDYSKQCFIYEDADKRESTFLTIRMEELKTILNTGIYDNFGISRIYREIVEIYQRLLLVYQRNVELANQTLIELKKIVEKYYTLKTEDTTRQDTKRKLDKLLKNREDSDV